MNLKITNIQIATYSQKQQLPNLQDLANGLCQDEADEIEYVFTESQHKQANLEKIEVGEAKSIFTKLREYPYEFEINSSLQLASINGEKLNSPDDDKITISKQELKDLIKEEVAAKIDEIDLPVKEPISDSGENYVVFSNGLKMCWGNASVTPNSFLYNVNLPVEFSNTNYIIHVSHASDTSGYHYYQPTSSISDNSTIALGLFQTFSSPPSVSSTLLNYMCIGY